jgi:hypothetical protein
MSHRNVEVLIGRLVTDPVLRRQFSKDSVGVLSEFREQGYELTLVEFEALASTDPDAMRSFACALDGRIRKADDSGSNVS